MVHHIFATDASGKFVSISGDVNGDGNADFSIVLKGLLLLSGDNSDFNL
ncbi:MAG TPA: hypothetical protein VIG52_00965 [Methyloceanibacter sp.]|jgi:hypothetical protein